VNLPKNITFEEAQAVAEPALSDFLEGKVDSVHMIYNEFKSVIQQKLVMEQLLPLEPVTEKPASGEATTDYIYEPSAQRIFDQLLVRFVEVQVMRALLESNAAFYAAQMTAMEAATRNSAEMIEDLTLTMNKVRQAAITREIIEVVSGAQAL
jgi:F-type H+-transporting ATPase subunit gamma